MAKIAFIGLGNMGGPMAANLVKKGHDATGFDLSQRLPRAIGLYKAKEMILSGEFYSAQACQQFGFVNRVVAPETLMEEARKLAATIASRGPAAVAKAKQSLHTGFELDITAGLKQEADLFGDLFFTEDHSEGIGAFIDKRSPEFKGK